MAHRLADAEIERRLRERMERSTDRSGGPDACHPWTGSVARGYGTIAVFRPKKKMAIASRVAWQLKNGPIASSRVYV